MNTEPQPEIARFKSLLSFWKNHALIVFLLITGFLFMLLLTASVRMVTIAVSSQPECVQHRKANEKGESNYLAAKSSC